MRPVICAVPRLSRPWVCQALTAAPPAILRYSSNAPAGNTDGISAESISAESTSAESTTADEFVKQVIDTPVILGTGDAEDRISSSSVDKEVNPQNVFRRVAEPSRSSIAKQAEGPFTGMIRKVERKKIFRKVKLDDNEPEKPSSIVDKSPPTQSNDTKIASPLVRKEPTHSTQPWRLPSKLWPENPAAALLPHRGLLTLRGLPLETTLRDIILAIDAAARHRKVSRNEALTADIVIKTSVDSPTEVDAVVDFKHPDGAKRFQGLVSKGEFRVRGVLPTASFHELKDPSKLQQAFESDQIIAQLSKLDRREYFTSWEQHKIVRRTHLIYN